MTANPQNNPQGNQPKVQAQNPDANRQFGQQAQQGQQARPGANPQNKAEYDPKQSTRPQDEEDEDKNAADKNPDMKGNEPYKKSAAEKY